MAGMPLDKPASRLTTEVRHCLHEMIGFLELVSGEELSQRQADLIGRCRKAAARLLAVAADLCELDGEQLPGEGIVSFQPAAAVLQVVEMAEVAAHRKGLALERAFTAAAQMRIEGPHNLLQDTVRRVLDNAIRYTERGHVFVSADLRMEEGASRLEVEIADSGDGLPAQVLEFLTKDGATPMAPGGLGLAIVKRRVAQMGGRIDVVSSPTAGTIVRLVIPVVLERPESLTAGIAGGGKDQSPLKILVAEDSDDSFYLFELFLRSEGHTIARALDGAEAMEQAQSEDFDVIVMDANMPVVDGYTATRAIREWESGRGEGRRIPILLCSADDPMRQTRLGSAAGCSGYLAKPASREELLRALQFFRRAS